jgi:hypothetical protein
MPKAKTATAGTKPAVASPEPATQAAVPEAAAPTASVVVSSADPAAQDPDQAPQDQDTELTFRHPVVVRSVAARGRWRIGRFFTQEPTEIPAGTLTMAQIDALAADPELVCATSD